MGRTSFAWYWLNERRATVASVAKMLGHSETMTEKHYAELSVNSFMKEIWELM